MVQDAANPKETMLLVEISDQAVGLLVGESRDLGIAALKGVVETCQRDQTPFADGAPPLARAWAAGAYERGATKAPG